MDFSFVFIILFFFISFINYFVYISENFLCQFRNILFYSIIS